ncbi:hypothetical protein DEU56DRAFT_753731 [Suillus clintonianus]|uniref:uncharacterized protein n=1 Tax=Suillus clintonianus TaxID=1904413 RepID=UPI001B8784B9|nr:uncharacterized protein DEU56DRAFT_753731 [Suillus clintonianus]KAG2146230.1 hypothetical protein DEU56DRAFT_753731 [Suillus clintonianus]
MFVSSLGFFDHVALSKVPSSGSIVTQEYSFLAEPRASTIVFPSYTLLLCPSMMRFKLKKFNALPGPSCHPHLLGDLTIPPLNMIVLPLPVAVHALLQALPQSMIYSNIKMTVGSATSDADDDAFPLTPNSKQSNGECRIADTSAEAESPTASHSPENQYNNAFPTHSRASSSESRHILDKLMDNITNKGTTSESIDQEVKETYLKHMGRLNAISLHLNVRVLEAIRERERMLYFASCWDVALFERRKDVAAFESETSKANFCVVEQDLRSVLDILAKYLSSPCDAATDGRHLAVTHESKRRCIRRADSALALAKHHGSLMEEKCFADN